MNSNEPTLTIIAFEQELVSISGHYKHHLAYKAYVMAMYVLRYTICGLTIAMASTNTAQIPFKCQGGLF